MFMGTVEFLARIKGNGLTFPSFEFDPKEPGVAKVEIAGPNGGDIRSTVHMDSVATRDDGLALATRVIAKAADRIAFLYNVSIENARSTGDQFLPVNPQPGVAHTVAANVNLLLGGTATVVVGVNAANLKTELERVSPPGEHSFAFFRSARLSMSDVEAFMHLYNILLMLYNDSQAQVDKFIVDEDKTVPQTQHPKKAAGTMETIYTRLRNEFAHRRPGVDINVTKEEMTNHLGGLVTLTKRAIELNP
jgi:hypothetical protein